MINSPQPPSNARKVWIEPKLQVLAARRAQNGPSPVNDDDGINRS